MNKILCTLMAVLALVAVIDCKVGDESDTNQPDLCSIIGCINGQNIVRHKRESPAVEILGGVERLVTGILETFLRGVARIKALKRKKTIVIGPGKHNKNTVTNTAFKHIKQPTEEEGEEIDIIGGGSYNDNTVVLDDSDYE